MKHYGHEYLNLIYVIYLPPHSHHPVAHSKITIYSISRDAIHPVLSTHVDLLLTLKEKDVFDYIFTDIFQD